MQLKKLNNLEESKQRLKKLQSILENFQLKNNKILIQQNCEVLILDEATSALDNATEKEIMNEIRLFNTDLTIIMVAHRLSTLTDADRIILLENGEIKEEGVPSIILGLRK